MRKPCASSGCPNLVGRGTSYCDEHAPPAWGGRSGNTMPKGWAKVRQSVLRRDRWECQLRYEGICIGRAAQADHIVPRAAGGGNDLDNLQAVCVPCHREKSKGEAAVGRL